MFQGQSLLKAIVAASLVTGCVTEGRDFNSDVTWIKQNRTSQKDVENILKKPYAVGFSAGMPTWTYGFYNYKLFGSSHTKELKFHWNPDGTVYDVAFSSNFPSDINAKGSSDGAPSAAPGAKPASGDF